ncbi:MAG: tetratricopeptide repeat protein [Armatimonadota bacterium]
MGDGVLVVEALLGRAFCLWRVDEAQAQALIEQALVGARSEAWRPLAAAQALNNVGMDWYNAGVLGVAQRCLEQMLAIYERLVPNSLEMAGTLNNLGNVAWSRGDLDGAQRYYEQALAIRERLAPNSLQVATTLHNLAQLRLAQRQPQTALQLLQRAAAIVEAQRQTITDPETRTLFAEQQFGIYPLLALAYLQLNQPAQAAEMLERSRARSLTETLYQRQLAFSANLPKPLRQLLQQQQQLNAQRLQIYRQLQKTQPDATQQVAQLQRALRELEQQQRALDDRLRKEFPDFARQYLPSPLSLQQIQQSLDLGTVLLYYALLKDHLLIVAVSRVQVQGVVRQVNRKQLERQVKELRRILSQPPLLRSAPERAVATVEPAVVCAVGGAGAGVAQGGAAGAAVS